MVHDAILQKERHVKYWLRCLKSFLPTDYMSTDANRMLLACFILSALDILGVLNEKTTKAERDGYIEWIYHCQHPDGGFKSFTGASLGESMRNNKNTHWDLANVAGTFFALSSLLILGDDLQRVKRTACLLWLTTLQCSDGSFAEVLIEGGQPQAGQDVRFAFLATSVRWMLRDTPDRSTKDINVDALVEFIMSSQTHEGGIGKAPGHEAHAGWTYCGVATMSLLNKLPPVPISKAEIDQSSPDQEFVTQLLRWLVFRHASSNDNVEYSDEDEDEDEDMPRIETARRSCSDEIVSALCFEPESLRSIGFNGRFNKPTDTCYSFWAGGGLAVLQQDHLLNFDASRRYLLQETQHIVGGFGKFPGVPPDILHSYLGLAALSLMGEPGLRSIDPTLCISREVVDHLNGIKRKRNSDFAHVLN